jgi:hypothetical protein
MIVIMGEHEEVSEFPALPDDLKHKVLVWLPVECICRFRCVCKEWNALLSSTKFVTSKWGEAPSNSLPWLVVQNAQSKTPNCLLYCFFTQRWKKSSSISLSFLKEKEIHIDCHGSASGLFLLGNFPRFVVANPLTREFLKLPPISSISSVRAVGIMEGEDGSRETYKVVAVGRPRDQKGDMVEIYDSSDKSWSIAGRMPEDVWLVRARMGMEMVFCDGAFYCLTIVNGGWGIMGFNIRKGIFVSAPLPEMAKKKHIFPFLLTCGSRVLVTGGKVKDEEGLLQEVVIWEFEKPKANDCSSSSSSWWKEIARMPPSLCEDVNRTLYDIDSAMDCPFMSCIGVGDCACFILNGCIRVMEVVSYSVSEKTWSRLPSCSLDKEGYVRVMAFGPRPDMKVG